MRLDIEKLTLQHFRSWNNPTTLDVAELGSGLHFVRGRNKLDPQLGSNGAGKSGLWGALCWCLYGRTPEGLYNVDVKPWNNSGSPTVSLTLTVDDAEHLVTRQIGSLALDDRSVGQEQIDQLLGMSYSAFTNSVVMGQGQPLFPDLSPAEKMKLFDSVMGLDRWLRRSRLASERSIVLEDKIIELKKSLAATDATLTSIEQSITDIKVQIEIWEGKQQEQARNLAKNQKQLEEQLIDLERKRDDADLTLDSALMELRPLQRQMRNTLDKQHELQRQVDKVTRLRKELKAIETNTICPLCKQPVHPSQLADHRVELITEIGKLKSAEAEIIKLKYIYVEMEKAEHNFQLRSDAAQSQLNDLNPKVGALKQEIEDLKKNKQTTEILRNPYHQHMRDLRSKHERAQAERAETEKQIRIKQRTLARTSWWVKGFKDVRLYAIEEVLQELQLMTNSMLEDVGLIGWKVEYAVERETKSGTVQRGIVCSIMSPGNDSPVKWAAWSGGESQRLRIICTLALSEVLLGHAGITTGFEILDEPTMHLSNEGIDDLIDYLAERARQSDKTIFYADQHSIESARFSSVVTVVKTKSGSRLSQTS